MRNDCGDAVCNAQPCTCGVCMQCTTRGLGNKGRLVKSTQKPKEKKKGMYYS